MADFTFKAGDSWPFLKAQLKDSPSGVPTPVNLTGATVRLTLKTQSAPGTIIVNRQLCVITDAAAGRVEYDWQPADTASVNDLNGEFEVTWGSGEITTFPNSGYFTVSIVADLD